MRATTTLGLLLFAFAAQAQSPYRPFPESDAGWSEGHWWDEPFTECGNYYRWIQCARPVYFGPDSLIDGVSYHSLFTHGLCSWALTDPTVQLPPWCSTHGSYAESQTRSAFIRQDVDQRKVLVRPADGGEEELLYDFTLGLGPYPIAYNNPQPGDLQVVALDSMLLNDGWHRTWVMGWTWMGQVYDSAFCHVIEGVGSTLGVLNPMMSPFPYGSILGCHSAAETTVYPIGATACELSVAVPENGSRPVLHVWPNPANALVHFNERISGWILDVTGRGMLHLQDASSVDLQGFARGTYAIITDEGDHLRIMKE